MELMLTKLGADVLWALAAASLAIALLRMSPALRTWVESRATKRSGEAVERLNGKLVEAIRLALADSVPFQKLIDARVERKISAAAALVNSRLDGVEDAQRDSEEWRNQAANGISRLGVVEAEVRSLRDALMQQRDDLDKLEARMIERIAAMQTAQTSALVTEIRAMHRANFQRESAPGTSER